MDVFELLNDFSLFILINLEHIGIVFIAHQVLNKTITYSYDAGGNILNKIEYPYTTGTLGTPTATIAYSYGDNNWKDKLTSYDGRAITYDSIGNPLTYDGWTFSWEQGRQLKGMTGNSQSISFMYNDDGIRTAKTVNGVTTAYHLLGDRVTFESNGTDSIYYTYDAAGDLISLNLNGTEYYYIRNAQGDITGLFNSAGTQVVAYTYDSWGKLVSTTGSLAATLGVKNPYRYRGYRYDLSSGFYLCGSRYYDPEIGRFISPDNTDSMLEHLGDSLFVTNLYAYCLNNPVIYSDPDGEFAAAAGALAWGAAAGGANSWNPVGWVILGVVGVAALGYLGHNIYNYVKVKQARALAAALATLSGFTATPKPPNPNDPKYKGTKTNGSYKLYEKGKVRVEVENMGNNPGRVHMQIKGDPAKYYYNPADMQFYTNKEFANVASKVIQEYLKTKGIVDALIKGCRMLGY